MTDVVLALDVGGTKVAAALVDGRGAVLREARRPTAAGGWAAAREAIEDVLHGADVRGVGIACAGPIDTVAGTVSPINIADWQDFPLVREVAELVPGVPVRLAGDGVCMALGEHRFGAGRSSDHLLGIVVSTGVGGGLVFDGSPFGGRTGNAGHIGHVVIEPGGAPCTCGGRGCAETVAAGPHLVRWARERGWTGSDAGELAESARAGDEVASAAFERGGHAVGLAIAATAAVCDLDLVVIGGGVAEAGELLLDPVRRTLSTHAGLSFLDKLRVERAELGARAGLVGAAALVG
ncbi:ROK family protein [Allokutzneria sp. NRRL B-24872]|uniref:ROK family protein n=1 Tax=Allokutzneria sp. NRRL B-24872 TaxID=1137961 RepID=UPI000A38A048|nr:ROK family protein [Allokutzneria sp. NRRL B-24872]